MDTKDKIATVDETIKRLSESTKKFQCELDTATEEYNNLLVPLKDMLELRDNLSGKTVFLKNF